MSGKAIKGQPNTSEQGAVGAKAEGLLFLKEHQFCVPDFFLLENQLLTSLASGEFLAQKWVEQWVQKHQIQSDTLWAVRSSANVEDGNSASYAGLFRTEINVSLAQLPAAMLHVIEGYAAVSGLPYASVEQMSFGLIIQQMVPSEYAGVLFSHNPFDHSDDRIYMNIVPGLGISLVSGQENALSVILAENQTEWVNESEDFDGQTYDAGNKRIHQSGKAIRQAVTPFLPEITQGIRRLVKLKKHPVDVEFAIAGGILYWLQVRPITSHQESGPTYIWDNGNIGENYPGITLPLSVSFVRYTYRKAYTSMSVFLGMDQKALDINQPLFAQMVGEINGSLYYKVTAWQQLLYQLPLGKKTSKQITKILNMEEAAFTPLSIRSSWLSYLVLLFNLLSSLLLFKKHKRIFEARYANILSSYKQSGFQGKNLAALRSDFHHIDKELAENWIVPVLNGFFAMVTFSAVKKIASTARFQKDYPNFANDILFAQGDIISVSIVRDFQALIQMIKRDEKADALFNHETPEGLSKTLENQFPAIDQQIKLYIERYGERCDGGELKMETRNYKDDPLRFLAQLQSNVRGAFPGSGPTMVFDYKMVLKEQYPFQPLRRWALSILIKITLNRIRDRENYRFLRTKAFAMVRNLFRAMDQRLLENGWIEQPGDSLYLELQDILNEQAAPQYSTIVAVNKARYAPYWDQEPVTRYIQNNKGFFPQIKEASSTALTALKGIGCCSGTITAKIAIISSSSVDSTQLAGRILVARFFEPGWIHLFAQAAGIVSEKGNLLSHTAILCREMGIPAIVGVKGILDSLQDGDTIQMNGSTGAIHILSND